MYLNHKQELHDRLTAFLADHAQRTGARVLGVLLRHPNRSYSVIDIAFRVFPYEYPPHTLEAIAQSAFRGIPLADRRAQAQYLERRNDLIRRRDAGEPNHDWEIGCLNLELRRITKPGGAIKNEYPEMKKAYHCFKMSLNRLIARAQTRDPELAAHIRAHLRTGLWCRWSQVEATSKNTGRIKRRDENSQVKSKVYIAKN